jgi:N-acetylglucosamine malate deacetylase 1
MDLNKILALSPHTDDAELGAGGTISRFLEEGKEVYYVAFSGCETVVPEGMERDTLRKECKRSVVTLGIPHTRMTILDYQVRTFPENRQSILDQLIKFRNMFKPELVLVPSSLDLHQDHGVIYMEALRAFKKEATIWGYEQPWSNVSFKTDVFVKLTQEHVEKKIRALKEYKSQCEKRYMDEKNIRALVNTRGAQLDLPYAEAFELVRLIY